MTSTSRPPASVGLRTLRILLRIGIVGAVALALTAVAVRSEWGLWWRLVTFTYQANLLAAAYYLGTLVWPRLDARVGLRGAVVLYVTLAGVVWNLLLTGHSMGYTIANVLLHVVVPALALIDWLLIGRGQSRVHWWQPLAWLVYPASYLALALAVLNHVGRRAPYYFLDPGSVGALAVALNVGALGLGVLAFGYVLLALNRAVAIARLNAT